MLDFTAGVDILLGAVATWQENRGEAVGEGGEVLVGAQGLGREGIGEGFARQGLLFSDGAGAGGGRGGVGGMEKVEIGGERRGGAPIGVARSGGGVSGGGGGGGGGEEKGANHGDARGEVEREELTLVEELVGGAQLRGGRALGGRGERHGELEVRRGGGGGGRREAGGGGRRFGFLVSGGGARRGLVARGSAVA
jgi:hypothetical protein